MQYLGTNHVSITASGENKDRSHDSVPIFVLNKRWMYQCDCFDVTGIFTGSRDAHQSTPTKPKHSNLSYPLPPVMLEKFAKVAFHDFLPGATRRHKIHEDLPAKYANVTL